MGIELAVLGTALATTGAVFGGLSGRDAAKAEASRLETQASIARIEAAQEAERRAQEVNRFRTRQKLAFLKSGVSLQGSPLLVLEETRREGLREVEAIRRRGSAQSNLLLAEADQTRNKGRAALMKGITQAGGSLFKLGAEF